MKRTIDIAIALLGGVLTAPLVVSIALIVFLKLGRPVLFVQERVGRGRRPFHLVKFRTMSVVYKSGGRLLTDEQRTSRFGKFLRRTRLDELPGFWNVLTGQMSIIGPRPLLPATIEAMGADGQRRCSVLPGMTGWAQIHGNAMLGNEDKLALDLWYIENRSLSLDLKIMFSTVALMIFGETIDGRQIKVARDHQLKREM